MQQQNLAEKIIWFQKQNDTCLNQTTLQENAEFCTSLIFTDRHDNIKTVLMTTFIEMKNKHSLSVSDTPTSLYKNRKRTLIDFNHNRSILNNQHAVPPQSWPNTHRNNTLHYSWFQQRANNTVKAPKSHHKTLIGNNNKTASHVSG
jgi:hypothetical protein